MKKTHIILSVVLLFMLMGVFSCKVAFINKGKGENVRPGKLYKNLVENEFEYNCLTMKFSAEMIAGESSETFSGMIRIQHDSLIWISLRSYNIEGARVCITQDSVKYLNRIDNTYYMGGFDFLTQKFQIDLDYTAIQAILTNNFFFYPAPIDTTKTIADFKQCDDSVYHCMSSISERKYTRYYVDDKHGNRWNRKLDKETADTSGFDEVKYESNEFVYQIIKVLPELFRVHDMYIENYIQQQSLYILYGSEILNGEQYFPQDITIELLTPKFETKVIITVESVTTNEEDISYPFKISDKYQQIIIE